MAVYTFVQNPTKTNPMDKPNELFVTRKTVADLTMLSVEKVAQLTRDGFLKAYKFPGTRIVRYHLYEVLEAFRKHPMN